MSYSDELYVSGAELTNTSNDAQDIGARFNNVTTEFNQAAKDLEQYWSGADYNAMMNNLHLKLDKIIDPATGSIPNLIRDIQKELNGHNDDYARIQSSNEQDWG